MKKEAVNSNKKARRVALVTLLIVVVTAALAYVGNQQRQKLVFAECLDKTGATLNGEKLDLAYYAFYVAYEEGEIQKQALVYDPEDPDKYWSVKMDNTFVSSAGRNAVIQMGIHDALFYDMALEEEIKLTEEDQEELDNSFQDFWYDLTDRDGQEGLGVSQEALKESMRRIALAQKMQRIYAELHNADYEDYNFNEDAYKSLLDQQDYSINRDLWRRISFGYITLDR